MTIEEKARAYDEALKKIQPLYEQAKKDDNPIWSTYEYLVPELSESEDEKTRKRLIEFISDIKRISESGRRSWAVRKDDIEMCDAFLSYLKKQKENPKSADSISSNCTSDAKCEDRWHKTANSLPDNGRDVLAKDALGNYLLASFDGAEWFVSVYDGEDHPVLHTPPILEWCEIPSEKQKEQKSIGTDFRTAVKNLMNLHKIKNKFTEEDYDFHTKELLELVEQKPAEWSEEDEDIRDTIIYDLKRLGGDIANVKPAYKKEIDWLKSIRPQSHWKPSEEQKEPEYYQHFDPDC